ncbi:hypothetical protein PVAND_007891 [Polypedilum vanderplanki]|uniref:Major facilitator superfamily (MFS) profile domain-containing protein n=1 Tax=Polypedilum vanderplanki TaxID=319348 RepID=A0A9J6C979_POLVA|nr:hypothetical protein PVAND_007891 [Polypedilum vanderplanki]
MVVDLAPPKINTRKIFPDDTNEDAYTTHLYYRDQLAIMKENLLNPAEVTFKVQENGTRRKRLTTISSEISVSDVSVTSSTYKENKKKMIPDGGYGWVIVFASLMVSLIADGISFSFGLIYTELLKYFNEGTTKTAWIGSLFMSVPLLVGPVMSNLVDKYGCQKMTMIGGVLGCAGFALSAISNSVEMLFITFGIISGLGLGVIYVTAVVSIAFWFEQKRTFATGIGASGTGIGTFLYAPFTQWLISFYGWRGATLILGGTLLNFCVFGALMIDPEWLIEENKLEARSQSIQTFSNSSMCLDEIKKLIETGAKKEDLLDTLVTNVNTEANQQIQDPDIMIAKKYQSEVLLPTFISSNELEHAIEGLRSCSRRSLRPELISPETISHDDNFSPSYINNNYSIVKIIPTSTKNNVVEKTDDIEDDKISINNQTLKCKIASVETLNSFEKAPSTDRDFEISSMNLSIDDHGRLLTDSDEFMNRRRSGMHGSRFSLNEIVFTKPYSHVDIFKDDLKKSFRGNSLNIVYENESFQPNNQSSPKKMPNGNASEIIIPIENSMAKFKYRAHKKQSTTMPLGGNLKRNPSLRYSNYLKNMRVHRNSIHYRGALLNTHRYRLKASSCPNIYRNSMTTIAKENEDVWYDDFIDIIKSIFDFSLFLEYKFAMMSLSTLFLFIWYIIPYFYITEFLRKFGHSEEASAYLISIIGIFNTVGMIVLGWVGDQKWCNVTKTYAFCLVLCGLSMFCIPFATSSYTFLMILCAVFGVTFGSSFSFTPMITSRLVDMDDFTLAYGLILLVQGIGSLLGPPLAGAIFDVTNRWDEPFFIGGVMVAMSGFLAYIIGSLRADVDLEEDENNNDEEVNDDNSNKITQRN